MNFHDQLRADTAEMAAILRTAKCIARHPVISHSRLAEVLTALVTAGSLTDSNAKGHDVISPAFGVIEVKSRVLGTDGPFPRVSLRASNIEKANFFVAVRWTPDMRLYDAIGLPRTSVAVLYATKRQSTGLAHLAWSDWIAAPGVHSFAEEMCRLIGQDGR